MKSFIISIAITVIICAASLFNSGTVKQQIETVDNTLDRIYELPSNVYAEELYDEWTRARIILGISANGETISEIDEAVCEVIRACKSGERGELQRACAVCRLRLIRTAEAEGLSWQQIF